MTISEANITIDNLITDLTELITRGKIINAEYDKVYQDNLRSRKLKAAAEQERLTNKLAYEQLTEFYENVKEMTRQELEVSLSDTINTWYLGAHYNLKFNTTNAGKAKHTFLIDEITGSDLDTVLGGSAKQVTGILTSYASITSKDSNLLFLDEACSNTDKYTAQDIGTLLNDGITSVQTIVIENKEDLTLNLRGLTYHLYFDVDENSARIRSIEDYEGIIDADSELFKYVVTKEEDDDGEQFAGEGLCE